MKKLFFNSSLPRSGSTLIQNIFAQNPDFYCTPTSGTLELIYGARGNYSIDPTFKAQDAELMRQGFRGFCKQGLLGFYDAITDKPLVLEKSRGWGYHYSLLQFVLNEPPKIICMVRDIKQIIASLEKKFREFPEVESIPINHAEFKNTTTPKRVDYYLTSQPLAIAIERINEIFRQGANKNIMFVRYEDLCLFPDETIKSIYSYFELPYYNLHNFKNIQQLTIENDSIHGIFGDHKIKSELQLIDNNPEDILGEDICDWLDSKFKWFCDIFKY